MATSPKCTGRHVSPHRFGTLCLLAFLLVTPRAIKAQSNTQTASDAAAIDNTARLVGIASELTQLRATATATPATKLDRWQLLRLHQHIYERVVAASLQVDATIAQIDNEIARASELRGFLADRRDRTVSRANLLSALAGGGLGATSSGLQLSSTLTRPAAGIGIGAGAFSAGFALVGIHAQQGRTSRFDFSSNMLAAFFDRPVLPDSRYPSTVWTFLNQPALATPANSTRRLQLVQTWINVKRIDSLAGADKIARLTSQPADLRRLSIDDLEDRAAMLQDVRARISFFKRDLGILLASLPPLPAELEQAF